MLSDVPRFVSLSPGVHVTHTLHLFLQWSACRPSRWTRGIGWRLSSLSCVDAQIRPVGLSGNAVRPRFTFIHATSVVIRMVDVFFWGGDVSACRCAQLELQDRTLRELCLSTRRDGEPLDATFTCRIGEITVRSGKMAACSSRQMFGVTPDFHFESRTTPLSNASRHPPSLPACRRGQSGNSRRGCSGLVHQ